MSEIMHLKLHNKSACNGLKSMIECQNRVTNTKDKCFFPHCSTFEDRMKTFDSWPKSMKIKPEALSEAGFFYLGHDDRAVCFHCGGGLNDWKEFDDPWVEHAYWFPKCKFVLNEKGQEFVDKAVGKKAEIISVQNSETIVNAIDEIMDLIHLKKKETLNTQKSQSSILCKLCFSEEKNILFFPCKHVAVCKQCSISLSTCPCCQQTVQSTIRIYNS